MTDIDLAFNRLEGLDLSAIESRGDWGLGRMFSHLAQGVEFSMHGYPVQKPRLFQATVGTLAFKVFSAKGKMSHGLNEPIPGEVINEISAEDGLGQLWSSLETFRDFDGAMQAQFGKAHLLHIENHLEEVG